MQSRWRRKKNFAIDDEKDKDEKEEKGKQK